jgi:hypothetical protein
LLVFLGRVPARIQAAIDMIADGSVTAEHFFHDHPSLTEIDLMTGKQIPQDVSLLDDLVKLVKAAFPTCLDLQRAYSRNHKSQKNNF